MTISWESQDYDQTIFNNPGIIKNIGLLKLLTNKFSLALSLKCYNLLLNIISGYLFYSSFIHIYYSLIDTSVPSWIDDNFFNFAQFFIWSKSVKFMGRPTASQEGF